MKERHSTARILPIALTAIALSMHMVAAGENEKPEWKGAIETPGRITETRMVALAEIPLDQAIHTALKKVAGKPIKAELESEDGYLIYGVEIVTPEEKVVEVILDPSSGRILNIEDERAEHRDALDRENDARRKA